MTPAPVLRATLSGVLLALAAPPASAAQSRTATVVQELTAFNASLPPALRAEKYARMKQSVFTFYRGTNHLYWKDFGRSPQLLPYGGTSATRTWISGDMHVGNIGAFEDSEEQVVLGLNDFDEAVIADYQLDVWRMAISLVLLTQDLGSLGAPEQEAVVDAFSEAYLDTMSTLARDDSETQERFHAGNTRGPIKDFLRDTARRHSRGALLDAWTVKHDGVRQLDTARNPNLAPVPPDVERDLRARMVRYQGGLGGGDAWPAGYFAIKGVAQRLRAGIGSLGRPRYYVLLEGASSSQEDDRLLDVKAQLPPTAWSALPAPVMEQTRSACHGDMALRVAQATQALGHRTDAHLGWMTLADGLTYSVRELSPWQESFPTDRLDSSKRWLRLAEQWGRVLATHHARADKDWNPTVLPHSVDEEIHARTEADHAGFRARVRALALDYASQVRLDHDSFRTSF